MGRSKEQANQKLSYLFITFGDVNISNVKIRTIFMQLFGGKGRGAGGGWYASMPPVTDRETETDKETES